MATIDTETSARFDIGPIRPGFSWPTLSFQRFQDEARTIPEAFMEGDYVLEVFTDPEYQSSSVLILQEGEDFVVDEDEITLARSAVDSVLPPRMYYFRVVCAPDLDNKYQIIHGTINVAH